MLITDITGHEWTVDCVGCAIATGELPPPGGKIIETEHFILHQDPEVPIKAFLIVASKQHVKSIADLTAEEAQEFFDLVFRARWAMQMIEDIREVTLIQEERSEHLHLWLLPRYGWMNSWFNNSLTSVRKMLDYMKEHGKNEKALQDILAAVELIKKTLEEKK